jgi:hypothetical protein
VRYLDTKFSGLSSEAKYNFADAKESQAADEVPSCDCSLPGCRSPTSCASGSSWARVGGCKRQHAKPSNATDRLHVCGRSACVFVCGVMPWVV